MTEAVRAVIDAAFASLPELARMQAGANRRNQASIRVMERLGMIHEGTIPHAPRVNGSTRTKPASSTQSCAKNGNSSASDRRALWRPNRPGLQVQSGEKHPVVVR